MVTRRDVARLAGTSESVVSYVLNAGPRNVAPATRDRVLAAIDELGYRPNAVARSLRTSRTRTLGLLVPDNANPFFAELAAQIAEDTFAAGHSLLLANSREDPDREAEQVRILLDRKVDGLMLIPACAPTQCVDDLVSSGVRCVLVDRELPRLAAGTVVADHIGGARAAVTHLLEHGRRRIACVAGPHCASPTDDRVLGWRSALIAAQVDPDALPLLHTPFGRMSAYTAATELLSGLTSAERPDAFFVTSDEQAVGVLRAALELGLRVPQDLAIASFDGIAGSAYPVPALTTVSQPIAELSRTAVRLLLDAEDPVGKRIVLPVSLLRRGSCGCPDPAGGGCSASASPAVPPCTAPPSAE
ncbi:LacI family DNA-binding transcriptional regulator [Crossiella cryophila]|uniref:LacI family transcriptional regulator n=1 Tax=Crossiella cryophila TaxID=43355 RepID=A0A7W7C9K7_9PSEU|nr:LacI family DNA-binding transcriptional regulator [Crossiella cryophila]MBB4677080.1 LacI family transcriptional regulator [Crossiella cryophila]